MLWVRELTLVCEVRRVRGMVERERGKRLVLALDEELEGAVDRLVVMALEAGVRARTRAAAVRWGVLEMARDNGPAGQKGK